MRAPRERWVVPLREQRRGAPRLICFPHAGGGTSLYRTWLDDLHADVDVLAILPPGREARFIEPPIDTMSVLVPSLAAALEPFLDVPFVLFGHSLGAVVAYETARLLEQRGFAPGALIASGRQAPHLPSRRKPIGHLPDAAFIREVISLGGTPAEVAASRELIDLLLPMLRTDFALAENYHPLPGTALRCPVIALGSDEDSCIDQPGLEAWRDTTSGPFEMKMFSGGHFYMVPNRRRLMGYLGEQVIRHSSSALV